MSHRIDEATERAIVGHYALGVTVAAICALLKVSRPTVYKALRRRGEQPDRQQSNRKRTP